jgi:hypothetical protein
MLVRLLSVTPVDMTGSDKLPATDAANEGVNHCEDPVVQLIRDMLANGENVMFQARVVIFNLYFAQFLPPLDFAKTPVPFDGVQLARVRRGKLDVEASLLCPGFDDKRMMYWVVVHEEDDVAQGVLLVGNKHSQESQHGSGVSPVTNLQKNFERISSNCRDDSSTGRPAFLQR